MAAGGEGRGARCVCEGLGAADGWVGAGAAKGMVGCCCPNGSEPSTEGRHTQGDTNKECMLGGSSGDGWIRKWGGAGNPGVWGGGQGAMAGMCQKYGTKEEECGT